jgi:hypothetical protein
MAFSPCGVRSPLRKLWTFEIMDVQPVSTDLLRFFLHCDDFRQFQGILTVRIRI